MTQLVAIYSTAGTIRAMSLDIGTGGSNADIWKAAQASVGEGDELVALVEGARGNDAFCMVGPGTFVTLADRPPAMVEANAGLTTAQRNAIEAATAQPAPPVKGKAKTKKGA